MRKIMGLEEVMSDEGDVELVATALNGSVYDYIQKGVVNSDVALGIVSTVKFFCQQRISTFNDSKLRRGMAEMLIAALEKAVSEGCNVSLLDD